MRDLQMSLDRTWTYMNPCNKWSHFEIVTIPHTSKIQVKRIKWTQWELRMSLDHTWAYLNPCNKLSLFWILCITSWIYWLTKNWADIVIGNFKRHGLSYKTILPPNYTYSWRFVCDGCVTTKHIKPNSQLMP